MIPKAGSRSRLSQPALAAGSRSRLSQPALAAGSRSRLSQPALAAGSRSRLSQPALAAGSRSSGKILDSGDQLGSNWNIRLSGAESPSSIKNTRFSLMSHRKNLTLDYSELQVPHTTAANRNVCAYSSTHCASLNCL